MTRVQFKHHHHHHPTSLSGDVCWKTFRSSSGA
ncbi:his operon leader peptide [Salmonella enterica subsp. enterica]|nr:his operon leader peptide [Salmonella enterica subsp. enterica]